MTFNKLHLFLPLVLLVLSGTISSTVAAKPRLNISINSLKDTAIINDCSDSSAIAKIIGDAIDLGAPIYNAGLHIGCYRIYEWAAYKIIYVYGKTCKKVEKVLREAIEKSHGDYSDIEKAWIMRVGFDKVMGVPTRVVNLEKDAPAVEGSVNG